MGPILLHVNYFEQGQTTEQACKVAWDLAADGIEFRRKPATFSGTDIEYLDEISRAWEKFPFSTVSFGGPGADLMSDEEGYAEKEIADLERFYRKAATRFPLKCANVFAGTVLNPDKSLPLTQSWHHGSAIVSDLQWGRAVNGFQRLGMVGQELGIRLAFETHGMYIHDTLESTMRLVREIASPHVGMLWDHANMMLFQEYPSMNEVIHEAGEKIFYVHLKNWLVPPSHFLAISDLRTGIINVREQLQLLLKSGYQGPICLESPRSGDRESFAKTDLEYAREVLNQLKEQVS